MLAKSSWKLWWQNHNMFENVQGVDTYFHKMWKLIFKGTNIFIMANVKHFKNKSLRLNPKVIMNITMAIKKMITNTWWIFFCLANQSFSSSFSFTSLGARMQIYNDIILCFLREFCTLIYTDNSLLTTIPWYCFLLSFTFSSFLLKPSLKASHLWTWKAY